MSDFLSNFSNDDYKDKMSKPKKDKTTKEKAVKKRAAEPQKRKKRRRREDVAKTNLPNVKQDVAFDDPHLLTLEEQIKEPKKNITKLEEPIIDELHDVEIDPEYQKQRNKKIIIGASSVAVIVIGYTTYYQMTRVKMPDFVDKSITDLRKWSTENRMELEVKDAYSLKIESSNIIKQGINPGKNVKKGSTINFTVSEGADPEEVIKLPDFKEMSENQVKEFVDKNKAENLNIINEYSDKVERKFTRIEFGNKDVTADTYRRRDSVNVYFSKGVEVFEKNIPVPDFVGKTKTEVDEWAQKSGVVIAYEEVDSDKVEEGKIIAQSVAKNQKVAKKDKLTIQISLGKSGIVVPYFGDYTAETSATAIEGLDVRVQQVFSDSVPYGQLISQSVETGTKLTGKDTKSIKVVYSFGQPYIKSYFGQLEGDIPKFIYDDFNSKGASITYDVYYVDSEAEKGQIVKMSAYNQYIASNSYITFGVSNGRFADLPGKSPAKNPEPELDAPSE